MSSNHDVRDPKSAFRPSFVIPKKKTTDSLKTDSNQSGKTPDGATSQQHAVRSVNVGSREFQEFQQEMLAGHYAFPKEAEKINYTSCQIVTDKGRLRKLEDKRKALKKGGYTDNQAQFTYGFLHLFDESQVETVAKNGIAIGNSVDGSLGVPDGGVYLSRHCDLTVAAPFVDGCHGVLVICKVIKGKQKQMGLGSSEMEPTVGFDSHVAKPPLRWRQSIRKEMYDYSRIYVYEYNGFDLVEYPSTVCPCAFVSWTYGNASSRVCRADYQVWKGRLSCGSSVNISDAYLQSISPIAKPFNLSQKITINNLIPLSECFEYEPMKELMAATVQHGALCKRREVVLEFPKNRGLRASYWQVKSVASSSKQVEGLVTAMKESKVVAVTTLAGGTMLVLLPPGELASLCGIPPVDDGPGPAFFHCISFSYRSACHRSHNDPFDWRDGELLNPKTAEMVRSDQPRVSDLFRRYCDAASVTFPAALPKIVATAGPMSEQQKSIVFGKKTKLRQPVIYHIDDKDPNEVVEMFESDGQRKTPPASPTPADIAVETDVTAEGRQRAAGVGDGGNWDGATNTVVEVPLDDRRQHLSDIDSVLITSLPRGKRPIIDDIPGSKRPKRRSPLLPIVETHSVQTASGAEVLENAHPSYVTTLVKDPRIGKRLLSVAAHFASQSELASVLEVQDHLKNARGIEPQEAVVVQKTQCSEGEAQIRTLLDQLQMMKKTQQDDASGVCDVIEQPASPGDNMQISIQPSSADIVDVYDEQSTTFSNPLISADAPVMIPTEDQQFDEETVMIGDESLNDHHSAVDDAMALHIDERPDVASSPDELQPPTTERHLVPTPSDSDIREQEMEIEEDISVTPASPEAQQSVEFESPSTILIDSSIEEIDPPLSPHGDGNAPILPKIIPTATDRRGSTIQEPVISSTVPDQQQQQQSSSTLPLWVGGQDVDMRPRRSRFDVCGQMGEDEVQLLKLQATALRNEFAAEPPPYSLSPAIRRRPQTEDERGVNDFRRRRPNSPLHRGMRREDNWASSSRDSNTYSRASPANPPRQDNSMRSRKIDPRFLSDNRPSIVFDPPSSSMSQTRVSSRSSRWEGAPPIRGIQSNSSHSDRSYALNRLPLLVEPEESIQPPPRHPLLGEGRSPATEETHSNLRRFKNQRGFRGSDRSPRTAFPFESHGDRPFFDGHLQRFPPEEQQQRSWEGKREPSFRESHDHAQKFHQRETVATPFGGNQGTSYQRLATTTDYRRTETPFDNHQPLSTLRLDDSQRQNSFERCAPLTDSIATPLFPPMQGARSNQFPSTSVDCHPNPNVPLRNAEEIPRVGQLVPDDMVFNRANSDDMERLLERFARWREQSLREWTLKLHSQVVLGLANSKKNLDPTSPVSRRISQILQLLTRYRKAGVVDLLPNHDCDLKRRAAAEYLSCVCKLAADVQPPKAALGTAVTIFLTNLSQTSGTGQAFTREGIRVMSLQNVLDEYC